MSSDNDFFVVLTSNATKLIHKHNRPNSFTFLIEGGVAGEGDWEVALRSIRVPSKLREMSDNGGPPFTLYVYADIVKETLFGKEKVNLLDVVPASNEHQRIYSPVHLAYRKVKVHPVTEISIMILDVRGDPITFEKEDDPTVLELHFRRLTF